MKKISSKRAKTEADLIYLSKLEWMASIYLDQEDNIVIPSEMIEALFINGARASKQGKQAQAGLICLENPPLIFDGKDLSLEELWERDKNRFTIAVRVQKSRVMRTRFIAQKWAINFAIQYNDDLFSQCDIDRIFQRAGMNVGIGDWRPKYGRFLATVK